MSDSPEQPRTWDLYVCDAPGCNLIEPDQHTCPRPGCPRVRKPGSYSEVVTVAEVPVTPPRRDDSDFNAGWRGGDAYGRDDERQAIVAFIRAYLDGRPRATDLADAIEAEFAARSPEQGVTEAEIEAGARALDAYDREPLKPIPADAPVPKRTIERSRTVIEAYLAARRAASSGTED